MMKAFKQLKSALRANGDSTTPIIKVGRTYLVFDSADSNPDLCEIAVLRNETGDGHSFTGYVSVRHLERLGNANWAERQSNSPALERRD